MKIIHLVAFIVLHQVGAVDWGFREQRRKTELNYGYEVAGNDKPTPGGNDKPTPGGNDKPTPGNPNASEPIPEDGQCKVTLAGNKYKPVKDYECAAGLECANVEEDENSSEFVGVCKTQECYGKQEQDQDDNQDKVTICHRTCSQKNAFVRITINKSAWETCGHREHTFENCQFSEVNGFTGDYLIKDHGSKKINDGDTGYWQYWEPACPMIRNSKTNGNSQCCFPGEQNCCGVNYDDPETPSPVTPAPVTPAPVTPAPVTPAPATPAPATPAPVTPAPVTPAPVTPAPVTPAPVTPAPVTPAPMATPGMFIPFDFQYLCFGSSSSSSSSCLITRSIDH